MTKKEMFTALRTLVANSAVENKEELIEGLNHEIELLEKKSSTPRKPTPLSLRTSLSRLKFSLTWPPRILSRALRNFRKKFRPSPRCLISVLPTFWPTLSRKSRSSRSIIRRPRSMRSSKKWASAHFLFLNFNSVAWNFIFQFFIWIHNCPVTLNLIVHNLARAPMFILYLHLFFQTSWQLPSFVI